jgi:hypothetical protein
MAERRRFKRRTTSVFFGVFDRNTNAYFGRIADMTAHGILLISEHPIDTDLVYQFRMDLPLDILDAKSITFDAEARWSQKSEEDMLYETGFEFVRITPDDAEVIEHIMANYTDKVADSFTTVMPLNIRTE